MPEHGEYDREKNMFYCSYWMNHDEWEEVHKYTPQSDDLEDSIVKSTETDQSI